MKKPNKTSLGSPRFDENTTPMPGFRQDVRDPKHGHPPFTDRNAVSSGMLSVLHSFPILPRT